MKFLVKDRIQRFLKDSLAVEITRVYPASGDLLLPPQSQRPAHQPNRKSLLYEADEFFNSVYERALDVTGTLPDTARRRERHYNLMQFLSQALPLDGLIVECGCWNGLSSFVMCHYVRRYDSHFRGAGFHICDSFAGLSTPTAADSLSDQTLFDLTQQFGTVTGAFSARLENVRSALAVFPEIAYHPGWIPESLQTLAEAEYKFVHVDVDLYTPTRGAVEYFYPRLVHGGLIICDDYGSLGWPGAKRAIDEYCARHNLPLLTISTAQAILWKR